MRWVACLLAIPVFAQDVRPLLESKCFRCHGGEQTLSGFDIGSADSLKRGGKHGAALVAGQPGQSRLYEWVANGKMPPVGDKLTPAEVAAVRQWIESGAEWKGIAAKETRREFWAFRSPEKSKDGPQSIDAFLLAKLKEKGLGFSARADQRTQIRRLHFDLTGLPPSPEELAEPYEKAVERLLASPAYGERWGRHWLDVVRFGETDGGEHNYERFHAWPYRDYVIESLNADKPYDQFIREQVAGDLLKPGDAKMIAATGFLVAGPWDQVSAELNKDKAMAMQSRMDELDDMVTTTFHTFQALTVNCARCHDHKFDPIPTRDYYRLTSVFSGAGFGTRTVATEAEQKAWDARVKPVREEIAALDKKILAIEEPVRAAWMRDALRKLDASGAAGKRRLTINPYWNRNVFARTQAAKWRFVISAQRGKDPARIDWLKVGGVEAGPFVASIAATSDEPAVMEIAGGAAESIEFAGTATVYRLEAFDGASWNAVCSSLDHIGRNEFDLPEMPAAELSARLGTSREERDRLVALKADSAARLKAIGELPKIYAARPREVEPSYVLDRGSVTKRGAEVTPGALTAIPQLPPDLDAGERRLALAQWLTDPRNPLTARVIVNRVWYFHFGRGIVNTPSDFGVNGDRPSHPGLLDWLAVSFMENGWSLKWLHRQILLSDAYRQSARMNEKAFAIDADNRLLWRMPLKRMDAETLRDSLLTVAGNLNLDARGGPSFVLQKKGDRGSYIYKALDSDGPDVWRRAVYRFVVRGGERIMLDSFDCPDPSVATPQRSASNTAVQALTLMNNEFVLRQAERLAARLEREETGVDGRIRRAHLLLYGREPRPSEVTTGRAFVNEQSLPLYCRVLLNTNEFLYVP